MALVVVQRLMGHTDITTTLNTYTSVYDKFKAQELEKVNEYYINENLLQNGKLIESLYESNEITENEPDL